MRRSTACSSSMPTRSGDPTVRRLRAPTLGAPPEPALPGLPH